MAGLADQVRAAIRQDGRSLYALAVASGMDRPALYRLIKGEREPKLSSVDGLLRVLGLELRPVRRRGSGPRQKRKPQARKVAKKG